MKFNRNIPQTGHVAEGSLDPNICHKQDHDLRIHYHRDPAWVSVKGRQGHRYKLSPGLRGPVRTHRGRLLRLADLCTELSGGGGANLPGVSFQKCLWLDVGMCLLVGGSPKNDIAVLLVSLEANPQVGVYPLRNTRPVQKPVLHLPQLAQCLPAIRFLSLSAF